ncbi:MAG: PP2C family protein-serine/threonine phosphatase [Jatrophihabitans sp.]|uniref:PP2C family protein-serine/threonine phosphatase n=1 Tax=Jatrophihabitans sp. TaxID=1932789 RepID=UPI003F811933
MALHLRYAVRSDLGLVRTNNEDSVYAGPRLLAIADGMGGHAAGEVASKIVIGTLENLDEDRGFDDLISTLRDTVAEANQRIARAVEEQRELEGMGTTLTALRFRGGQVGLVHVGDSRAYLFRGGVLSQITHDDTYVQYLVDSGKLTPEEAKDHPRRSVILKALLGSEVAPDVSIREAQAGDRYLLCSDGLSDVVSEQTIGETMMIADTQECADRLVELALRGGGPDNVTVIVADVIEAGFGDGVDLTPVVAGALVDGASADESGDSPAEKARDLTRTVALPVTPPEPTASTGRRWGWRRWVLVLGVPLLVVAALAGTYAWTRTQWFVGKDGNRVAIFRGVNAGLGPLKLYTVDSHYGGLTIDELPPAYQGRITDGISVDSLQAGMRKIDELAGLVNPSTPPAPTPVPSSPAPSSPATSCSSGASASPPRSSAAPSTRSSSGTARPRLTTSKLPVPTSTSPRAATPSASLSGSIGSTVGACGSGR